MVAGCLQYPAQVTLLERIYRDGALRTLSQLQSSIVLDALDPLPRFVSFLRDHMTHYEPLIALALSLTVPDWNVLGFGDDPETAPTGALDTLVNRTTALLLVRCVAVIAPLGSFADLSTSTICRAVLMKNHAARAWPAAIDEDFVAQLREFVERMLKGYKDVPYHNREHAFHVLLSVNKLIDMIVSPFPKDASKSKKPPPSFGLRHDPMALLALVFAALIHDTEHQGIPNRQLALEDDRLAVLYNDQSIAENWSVYVAFSEFLQDEFQTVHDRLFSKKEDYHRFRKMVINLVLTTDIASPERTQLVKSKWKEAFGDPIETIERKMRAEARRMSLTGQHVQVQTRSRMARRGTNETNTSDVSADSARRRSFTNDMDDGGADDSPSLTPEHSDTEDAKEVSRIPLPPAMGRRRSSAGTRRSSTASRNSQTTKYRQRLGILRTVDLSGETLEQYSRHGSIDLSSRSSQQTIFTVDIEEDEPDDLKMTVVMETIIQAADVAHNLQGWDHMVKFSNRLYFELRKAFAEDRGMDPEPRWFENQIGFLESYLLPLAHRLEDTGVFGPDGGCVFAATVESLRDRWLTDGFDVATNAVLEGATKFPLGAK